MKTAKIKLNYDFTGVEKVKIENSMAPVTISVSSSGQIEIEAELRVQEPSEERELGDYFHISQSDHTVSIELEEIPELQEPFMGTGKSQVQIRIPKGVAVIAEAELHPISAEGLEGALVIHNENSAILLSNCSGHIHLENENGPIRMQSCSGDFEIDLENGPLSAEKLSGDKLEVESENGPVKIRLAAFRKVAISNENGVIYYETLPVENGEFSFENENGVVHLVLPDEFDFELDAETESGSLVSTIEAEKSTMEGHKILRRGEGNTKITVKTENGVIKVSSGGQGDLGFLKLKIHELKAAINNAVKPEDKEQVLKTMNTVIASVQKMLGSVTEEKVKDNLSSALDKLKTLVENFDVKETKDKVVNSVDQIGNEVVDGLKGFIRKVKEPWGEGGRFEHSQVHRDVDSLKEYIHKVINSSLLKPYLGKGMSARDKQDVDERSRMKILEMLESGKITAEEAERLLKAIGKE